jgi:hypothetical protein
VSMYMEERVITMPDEGDCSALKDNAIISRFLGS